MPACELEIIGPVSPATRNSYDMVNMPLAPELNPAISAFVFLGLANCANVGLGMSPLGTTPARLCAALYCAMLFGVGRSPFSRRQSRLNPMPLWVCCIPCARTLVNMLTVY
jgi:hypothetical protein